MVEGASRHHSLIPGVFLRGVLMGAADIVPGVSGGTMAFITGIYHRLLAAVSAVDPAFAKLVLARRWREAWIYCDGAFLLTLLGGIAVSVFSLARLITHLLETQPLLVWSLFFGLILGSAVTLTRHVDQWSASAVVGLLLAAAVAAGIAFAPDMALPDSSVSFFFAGFVAICAMILPGVSGSFLLVLLGMYERVLTAIETLDLLQILVFAAGAGSGLLVFSRLLNLLLARYHAITLASLTGFLFGSLTVVWPWKLGDEGAMQPAMPGAYAAELGGSQLLPCLALMAVGLALVALLESRWGGLER
ncbi:MAG: DUF368 domain-containing protein [Pseudomonadota bacterium]